MLKNNFYIYQWVNKETGEVFYIGKGSKKRAGQIAKRNSLFQNYIKENKNCQYEIIEYYDDEIEAYKREEILINKLKPKCNIAHGGYGGFSIIWTDELRKWKSENNPMKDEQRRQNMSINNPMKNPECVKKVTKKLRKIPIINGKEFKSVKEASKFYNVCIQTIWNWCKRGYDTQGNPCHYKGEEQKQYVFKRGSELPVIIDGIFYKSVKDGSKAIDVWSSTLIKAIKQNKKCKGHDCKYANQQPSQVNVGENSNLEGSETNE